LETLLLEELKFVLLLVLSCRLKFSTTPISSSLVVRALLVPLMTGGPSTSMSLALIIACILPMKASKALVWTINSATSLRIVPGIPITHSSASLIASILPLSALLVLINLLALLAFRSVGPVSVKSVLRTARLILPVNLERGDAVQTVIVFLNPPLVLLSLVPMLVKSFVLMVFAALHASLAMVVSPMLIPFNALMAPVLHLF